MPSSLTAYKYISNSQTVAKSQELFNLSKVL